MKTFNISTTAGYKGCGEAFALIHNLVVIQLTYIDKLLKLEDWDNLDDGVISTEGELKLAGFAERHPELKRGMCSCWQFCVS